MDTEHTPTTYQSLGHILRRRAVWIFLCCVISAAAVYAYSKTETKKYTATAALSFNDNPLYAQIAGLSNSGTGGQLAQQNDNVELVKLGVVAAKTASLIGRGLTAAKVSASVAVRAQGETNIVDVSATVASKALAASIANTYVNQFVQEQQRTNREFFKSALALVDKQLAALSPAQRVGSDGLDLQDRAHTLALLAELGYNNVVIAQEAAIPTSPSSPKTKTNVALGAMVGLLLGVGIAFLLERLDDRIREPMELEHIYGLPALGAVPASATLARSGNGQRASIPPGEAETFSLIRAHMRFFHGDRDLRLILVASPAADDGKTTIALHLANAAARSGARALLIEANMRHPTLAEHLGLQPQPGLADVLSRAVPLDEATQSVTLQEPTGDATVGNPLDVLTAGGTTRLSPAGLLDSSDMEAACQRARSAYDFVVIDTPPLTTASDAFPLLTQVDGVVIVGRIGHSRRAAAEQLHHILTNSAAPLLGVIVNSSKSSTRAPYGGSSHSPSATAPANTSPSSSALAPSGSI
jgi:capsular exopolysaccharide synthesis family protein